ncbi:hypothetical protein DY037_05400 [Apilactobacillus micheneri]|uniref:hypothetical protein n=1 Tax=Apilactobacillus micheneri TaxID=1899430 RepID=UPI00112742A6|nr:hypothetical protein [Apilactobacillus micheneri]TPR49216.1 hypothetical protein DY037_05400 [Apilactobacillus micheneri]
MDNKQQPMKTVTYHIPENVYIKFRDAAEKFHLKKKDLFIGMIDHSAWQRSLPPIILENSDQYIELVSLLNQIKGSVGHVGQTNQQTINTNQEYLKLALSALQDSPNSTFSDQDKLQEIIENQKRILKLLEELKSSFDKIQNPLLNNLDL